MATTNPNLSSSLWSVADLLRGDYKLSEYGKGTTEAQRAIDLLQGRRTALISAAVTGQIDVRGVLQ